VHPGPDPRTTYREGRDRARSAAADGQRRSRGLTALRGGVFLAFLICLALVDPLEGSGEPAALAIGAALMVVFAVLVGRHRRIRRDIARHELLAHLHEAGLARLERDWEALDAAGFAEGPGEPLEPGHPYGPDLHIFGHASLFRLAGPVVSAPGRRTLGAWLASPAPPEEIARRREAVRALAPEFELRMRLAAEGLTEGTRRPRTHPRQVEALLAWAEAPPWLAERRAIRAAAVVLPPVSLALLGLDLLAGWSSWWLLPLLLQVAALRSVVPRIDEDAGRAISAGDAVRRYERQLAVIPHMPATGLLEDVRAAVAGAAGEGGIGAGGAIGALRARLDFAESRHNMAYQGLNYLLLLDVWVHRSLERWREVWGGRVAGWIEALGQAEALSGLATMAGDHPDWCWPDVRATDGPPRLRARELGHPLIPPSKRVSNDVEVGPPDTFLLVTGSNMSGKSTLLRAIGANVALAQAGGPACARELSLPPLRLWTSMMVGDSLEDGVSRFMAELLRLREVVDAARHASDEAAPVVYLLDEILQGTNTAERRVAARTALRHLLDAGAIGVVTSHDLTLHQVSDLERRARSFHFRETVERVDGRPRLHFDYRLRPGLSTTTNALELLEAVGLARPDS